MSKRIEPRTVHGGGEDGTAIVLSFFKNRDNKKLVKFVSVEAKKIFTITKPHFVARFPETLS